MQKAVCISYLYFELILRMRNALYFSELFISKCIYLALILSLTNCVTMESYLMSLNPIIHIFKMEIILIPTSLGFCEKEM